MAETKKYYWLKLKEDFFKDKEIKKLRKIAGGDTYTIIYLKLMLLGLKDEGKLFFEGIEDSFAEELALELDEDTDNVKVTLLYLLKMGLLQEVNENELFLSRLPECVGKETAKAELMRKKRSRDKAGNELPPPKTNAERQASFKAKQFCESKQHIPLIEDYTNKVRYNGNYYVVFKRDMCRCKMCGSIEELCVHHIDGFDENNTENSNKNKMVTLCRSCHIQVHRSGLQIPHDVLESIDYFEEGNESNKNALPLPDVTFCYTEKEQEQETEIEKEQEQEQEQENVNVSENPTSCNKPYALIVDYLNLRANTKFKSTTKTTQNHINARLKEGFTVKDFKIVIDKKCAQWLNNPKMVGFLRPETLFGTKMESYLNEPLVVSKPIANGQEMQIINGKEYIFKNGNYYVPNGSNIAVNPFVDEDDDLPY